VNFARHVEDQFQWLLTMARDPGFKGQAWHRAKELAASDPMYREFPDRLKQAMQSPQS
jgi:hypothetical protein